MANGARFPDASAARGTTALAEAVFARTHSIAEVIENLLAATRVSIDAALHRFNSQRLARALLEAHERKVRIRLLTDRSKLGESAATRRLISTCGFAVRVTQGRDGDDSKMHHKFAVLDRRLVITGSYNWTFASEERNHENVVLLREPKLIETFNHEFEALWVKSDDVDEPGKQSRSDEDRD